MELSEIMIWATLAVLGAGILKGTMGIGFPTASISFLTLMISPRDAITLIIFPMLLSNALQMVRQGKIKQSAQRYWPLALTQIFFIGLTLYLSRNVQDQVLFLALGAVILVFAISQFIQIIPKIPDHKDRAAQITGGIVAGVLGGLTSLWALPIVIYLTARQADKDEFVRATGFLITAGSIPLLLGYYQLGYLTGENALNSLLLTIPAFAGFMIGERIRTYLSERVFFNALMVLFFIMGLNLLRRGLIG